MTLKSQGYDREFDRIHQFVAEANGDDQKLRAKLLVRAQRCGEDKLKRFIWALRQCHQEAIATWIEVLMAGNPNKTTSKEL